MIKIITISIETSLGSELTFIYKSINMIKKVKNIKVNKKMRGIEL